MELYEIESAALNGPTRGARQLRGHFIAAKHNKRVLVAEAGV